MSDRDKEKTKASAIQVENKTVYGSGKERVSPLQPQMQERPSTAEQTVSVCTGEGQAPITSGNELRTRHAEGAGGTGAPETAG